MKSKIGALLSLPLNSGLPRVRLASLIVLAWELEYLKHSMQYAAGPGSWQAFRDEVKAGTRPTWAKFCIENASVTERTQASYLKIFELVIERFIASSNEVGFELMRCRPSSLTPKEREVLIDLIVTEGLTERDSFSSLKREAQKPKPAATPESKLVLKPSPSPLDVVFQAAQIQEMALAAGVESAMAGKIAMKILARDYSATGNPRGLIRYWKKRPVVAGSQTLNTPEK